MKNESEQGRCELLPRCPKAAVLRYPAMGGGYMRLCAEHGLPHARYCEEWTGTTWEAQKVSDAV